MDRMGGWIAGFGRFWYSFIIGDDWTVAAAVLVGSLGTWALVSASISAWWLLPLVVVASTTWSVWRKRAA